MDQKKFLIRFGMAGCIIPILISAFVYGTGTYLGMWGFRIFGFFWITFFSLMAMQGAEGVFDLIFTYSAILSFNIGYYVFLGWLFWLGKTRNKLFYLALPIVIYFAWSPIYLKG